MARIIDDKSQYCVPFILKHFRQHKQKHQGSQVIPPMFVGLQGIQGAGKTTLAETLYSELSSLPHSISTIVLSIDDLYLAHAKQRQLAEKHADNPLVQHRGVPGTHDIELGQVLFDDLKERRQDIRLPSYDKSADNGAGDRRPEQDWHILNPSGGSTIDLVILEGWCVGFRALSDSDLERSWHAARLQYETAGNDSKGQLGRHQLSSVQLVNTALAQYDVLTDTFSCFIQIDAEDLLYVYDWRLEQEAALRQRTGSGMTDEQVINFVNGYYPCYELYTETLEKGVLEAPGQQLRIVVDRSRKVIEVAEI